jgi:hypothetical protein
MNDAYDQNYQNVGQQQCQTILIMMLTHIAGVLVAKNAEHSCRLMLKMLL